MGSGEKIQLPALWTPSLPILPPFPQLSSLLPFSSPSCSLLSEFLGEKGNKWSPSELQTHSFTLQAGSVPFPGCVYSTVGPRFVDAVLLPPGVQSWLQRQEWGLESRPSPKQ